MLHGISYADVKYLKCGQKTVFFLFILFGFFCPRHTTTKADHIYRHLDELAAYDELLRTMAMITSRDNWTIAGWLRLTCAEPAKRAMSSPTGDDAYRSDLADGDVTLRIRHT